MNFSYDEADRLILESEASDAVRYVSDFPELAKSKGEGDWTLLHSACHMGCFDVVKTLVRLGAEINAVSRDDLTPLSLAIGRDYLDITKFLLDNGADPSLLSVDCFSELAGLSDPGFATYVFSRLPWAAKLLDENGRSPLHCAARSGRAELASLLIDLGANVNARSEFGEMPLHAAAREKSAETIDLLIRRGAQIDAVDGIGDTPIRICRFDPDCVRVLVSHGAVPVTD